MFKALFTFIKCVGENFTKSSAKRRLKQNKLTSILSNNAKNLAGKVVDPLKTSDIGIWQYYFYRSQKQLTQECLHSLMDGFTFKTFALSMFSNKRGLCQLRITQGGGVRDFEGRDCKINLGLQKRARPQTTQGPKLQLYSVSKHFPPHPCVFTPKCESFTCTLSLTLGYVSSPAN